LIVRGEEEDEEEEEDTPVLRQADK